MVRIHLGGASIHPVADGHMTDFHYWSNVRGGTWRRLFCFSLPVDHEADHAELLLTRRKDDK
jgi:hypothetical protein